MVDDNNITGIILSGGTSTRMGTDKGSLIINGSSFLTRIIESVKPIVNDIIIVSNDPNHDVVGCKRVNDIFKESGPLAGLYTGLFHSTSNLNLVLSCDIPFIKTSVLQLLVDHINDDKDVIQIESKHKSMPLIALYKKECMHQCLDLLEQGERRLRFAVKQFKTKNVLIDPELDPHIRNINTTHQFNQLKHELEH
jgi:molybdopterin-guanine dinucleotide biosynthesis protein A